MSAMRKGITETCDCYEKLTYKEFTIRHALLLDVPCEGCERELEITDWMKFLHFILTTCVVVLCVLLLECINLYVEIERPYRRIVAAMIVGPGMGFTIRPIGYLIYSLAYNREIAYSREKSKK